jgi:hypothetical protein
MLGNAMMALKASPFLFLMALMFNRSLLFAGIGFIGGIYLSSTDPEMAGLILSHAEEVVYFIQDAISSGNIDKAFAQ